VFYVCHLYGIIAGIELSDGDCRNRLTDGFSSLFVLSCRVVESNNPAFPVGSHVVVRCGWRSHTVCDGKDLIPIMPDWPKDVSMSLALGGIGMPG